MPKAANLIGWVWVGIFVLLLFGGCTEKKVTSPSFTGPFLMTDYFPLSQGNEWTWEVVGEYWIPEKFIDGDSSLGEPFTDVNQNGKYDNLEPFEDVNNNQKYDGPNVPWTPPIPYADRNNDGEYDAPNGYWDEGELFLDLDGNGVYTLADTLTLYASVVQTGTLNGKFLGIYSDGNPGGMWAERDIYSNDSLGLRWHAHIDCEDTRDLLAELCDPLVIAVAEAQVGDTILSHGCLFSDGGLLCTFEGIEDISVPAGNFKDCFKFKLYAIYWEWSMERFNGVSYRWYAKDVGLVKSVGPYPGASRVLKNATVRGVNYPKGLPNRSCLQCT
jgi:hypothetical protein